MDSGRFAGEVVNMREYPVLFFLFRKDSLSFLMLWVSFKALNQSQNSS
jgi:hypothetical protein